MVSGFNLLPVTLVILSDAMFIDSQSARGDLIPLKKSSLAWLKPESSRHLTSGRDVQAIDCIIHENIDR